MRRHVFALAATAGLTLAALAGPVIAGQVSPAAAVTVRAEIGNTTLQCNVLMQCWYAYIQGNGVGKRATLNASSGTTFKNTGQSGKWTEIEDTSNHYCLNLTGSAKAGYTVNEENCNGRSAELWWVASGIQGEITQIISQYGTKLLGHDACMWETSGSVNQLIVVDCRSKKPQPSNQLWIWNSAASTS
jgi:hypothetical protein